MGAFKWVFRRFSLEIRTVSGNFKVRFVAGEHPYGYLLAGEDSQVHGFVEKLYYVGTLLTTEQQFVDDIDKAIEACYKRGLQPVVEDKEEEEAAIEQVKAVQEYVEMPKKEKKRYDKKVNKKFKKVAKKVNND